MPGPALGSRPFRAWPSSDRRVQGLTGSPISPRRASVNDGMATACLKRRHETARRPARPGDILSDPIARTRPALANASAGMALRAWPSSGGRVHDLAGAGCRAQTRRLTMGSLPMTSRKPSARASDGTSGKRLAPGHRPGLGQRLGNRASDGLGRRHGAPTDATPAASGASQRWTRKYWVDRPNRPPGKARWAGLAGTHPRVHYTVRKDTRPLQQGSGNVASVHRRIGCKVGSSLDAPGPWY